MKLISPANIYEWPNPADPLQTIGPVLYFANYQMAETYMTLMYRNSTVPVERRRDFMKEVDLEKLPGQDKFAWLPLVYG